MSFSVLHFNLESDFRGTENQLLLLHESLLAAGVRSYVLALEDSAMVRRAQELELAHIYRIKTPPLRLGDFNPWLSSALVRISQSLQPSIVHAHGARAAGAAYFAKPFLPQSTKLVFQRTVSNPLSFFSKFKYRAADALIVMCEYIRNDLMVNGLDPNKIRVIPSGMPWYGNGCEEGNGGEDRERKKGTVPVREQSPFFRIGSLSALDKHQKDVATLIRAFALLSGRYPDLRLLIFGDGPDRPFLERLTREMNLQERVEFKGWWERPLPEALAQMDCFVLPSLYEGTSNVLIAAMACALPCIATDIGGNPEVLGSSGLLVPAKDPQAMASAIERIYLDQNLRRELAQRARRRFPEFSLDRMVARTLSCYEWVWGRRIETHTDCAEPELLQ